MTRHEKEKREAMYQHYGYKCFVCGEPANQAAHIIGNTLLNRKLFGKRIVDHELNMLPACSLSHNKKIDIGKIPHNLSQVVYILESMFTDLEKRESLERLVREHIRGEL